MRPEVSLSYLSLLVAKPCLHAEDMRLRRLALSSNFYRSSIALTLLCHDTGDHEKERRQGLISEMLHRGYKWQRVFLFPLSWLHLLTTVYSNIAT